MENIFNECLCHGKRLYPFGGVSVHIQDTKIDFVNYPETNDPSTGDEPSNDDDSSITVNGPVDVKLTVTGEEKVGEIVTTQVALNAPEEYVGKNVRVRVTITPAGANKPKYKEGDQWLDLPMDNSGDSTKDVFYFGTETGFPLSNEATSEFSNELMKSGKITTTLEVIDVETGKVISTATQTVDIAE